MYNLDDTIVAISTPIGEGGIGIVRISGARSLEIADRLFKSPKGRSLSEVKSHQMIYGYIIDPERGTPIDEVLLSVMRAPATYTKEDIVEINCHGGLLPMRKVLEAVIRMGARMAEPGEFTFRAFMNGRIDLSQAEATLDLIRAKTESSERLALEQLSGRLSEKINHQRDRLMQVCAHIEAYLDFPEEDIETAEVEEILNNIKSIIKELKELSGTYEEGRFFREGLAVAIVGRPNVGKSSLLNALMEQDRAIVTELPGTTRDVLEEYINIEGVPLRIMDTAGIREAHDLAEVEGVRRSLRAIEGADLVLAVFDCSTDFTREDALVIEKIGNRKAIVVLNKADLPMKIQREDFNVNFPVVVISAKKGDGIRDLKETIISMVFEGRLSHEGVIVTNVRHKLALERASMCLERAFNALQGDSPYEIVAFELRDALDSLGEIVGAVTTDDILNMIFSQFCIGK